jgi:hypothetical protein
MKTKGLTQQIYMCELIPAHPAEPNARMQTHTHTRTYALMHTLTHTHPDGHSEKHTVTKKCPTLPSPFKGKGESDTKNNIETVESTIDSYTRNRLIDADHAYSYVII